MNSLIEKFPKFFNWTKEVREENPNEPLYPIEFGIECGKGWYWLLDNLLETISNYIENNYSKLSCPIKIVQIKEKFGGLRFYYDGGDDMIRGMVLFAEDLSYKICETCGSTKEVFHTSGWIKTICKKCYEANKKSTKSSE